MSDLVKVLAIALASITTVAIVAVLVGPRSQTAAALQAVGSVGANVVAAAVNPVHTSATNGDPWLNPFSQPLRVGQSGLQEWLGHLANTGLAN